MEQKKQMLGHMAALFTILVWGTTFVSTKVLLRDFTPVEVLFTRFALGLITLCIMNWKPMKLKDKKHEWYFLGAGATGILLYFLLENIALTYTTASNVGILLTSVPFITGILSKIFLKEQLNKMFYYGFIFAIIGILLINFNGNVVLKLNPIGDILALIAGVVWAFYCIFIRKIGDCGYDTVQTTRRVFSRGIVMMIPVLIYDGYRFDTELLLKPVNFWNFLYLGIGACAICFVTWNFSMKVIGTVKTSIYLYLSPVVTIIASAIVLHEKMTVIACVGTAFILSGLILSERGNKK